MSKIKVGIIFGGQSTEHDVSVVSGSSVIKNISKEKYEVYPIYISKEGKWYHYAKKLEDIDVLEIEKEPEELEEIDNEFEILKSQDVIFPVMHGTCGEDGSIQGLLNLIQVPYVGCKTLASSLCMNKIYTKIIFEKANIKQAKGVVINVCNNRYFYVDDELNKEEKSFKEICDIVEEKLEYPVFIKPSNYGSSVGVSKAKNIEELEKSIKEAEKFDKEILIEQGIIGREVECAVLGCDDVRASCIGEIMCADEFYDYNSKYKNNKSKTVIPADISEEISDKIRKTAIKAFKAVNGTGLARVDFFIEKDTDEVYINEINTMPGFTNISMYPQLWEKCGLQYEKLIDELIKNAI